MTTKHTPGPWSVVCKMSDGYHIGSLDESEGVAVVWKDANARLIAAAPDLAQGLETALEFIDMIAGNWDNGGDLAEAVRNAVEWAEEARAALAKAGVAE